MKCSVCEGSGRRSQHTREAATAALVANLPIVSANVKFTKEHEVLGSMCNITQPQRTPVIPETLKSVFPGTVTDQGVFQLYTHVIPKYRQPKPRFHLGLVLHITAKIAAEKKCCDKWKFGIYLTTNEKLDKLLVVDRELDTVTQYEGTIHRQLPVTTSVFPSPDVTFSMHLVFLVGYIKIYVQGNHFVDLFFYKKSYAAADTLAYNGDIVPSECKTGDLDHLENVLTAGDQCKKMYQGELLRVESKPEMALMQEWMHQQVKGTMHNVVLVAGPRKMGAPDFSKSQATILPRIRFEDAKDAIVMNQCVLWAAISNMEERPHPKSYATVDCDIDFFDYVCKAPVSGTAGASRIKTKPTGLPPKDDAKKQPVPLSKALIHLFVACGMVGLLLFSSVIFFACLSRKRLKTADHLLYNVPSQCVAQNVVAIEAPAKEEKMIVYSNPEF